ncbi:hypothetical protein Tco_0898064 [Tanacetum coccineum]
MLHPSRYFEMPKTLLEEMMRKWMASQTEANERMKDQVVELENQINQGLRNRQPPSILNKNDKGDAKAIKEDETKPIPTMPNPNLINSNSLTISHILKEYAVHVLYTNAKMFVDDVLLDHVGDEELNSIDGVGTGKITKKNDKGIPKELNKEWKLNEKVVPYNRKVYHHQWHPTEIPHLNRIIKES